ncbi:MAG: NAD(P)-dependent oxidoreductase [Christensenellales bacterium]
MEKIKVALSSAVVEPYRTKLETLCDITPVGRALLGRKPTEDELLQQCMGHDIVYISDEVVTAKCIKAWQQSGMRLLGCGRGTPVNVDWKAVHKCSIPLVYTPGRNANSVSEFTFGLILGLIRRIAADSHALRSGRYLGPAKENVLELDPQQDVVWFMPDGSSPMLEYGGGFELYGRTLGLIGFGAIGRRVGHTAKQGFGMHVQVYDPYCPAEAIESCGCEKAELSQVLSTSDIVSVHLPVNAETRGIFDASWFAQMKSTALFINTARASVVDQKALIDALDQKKIAGAAMDVMWQEPAPQNHPLLDRDNVLITSHLAGMSCDVDRWQSEMIYDEIERFVQGQPPLRVWTRTE